MSQEPIYVGLDVSKERIDIAARPTGTSWSVSYDSDGVDDLVAQLKELSPAGVITESTGGLSPGSSISTRCCCLRVRQVDRSAG